MSSNHESFDRDLREPFQALRRSEAAEAPPFEPTRRPARASSPAMPARLAWSTAIVILGAVIMLSIRGQRPTESSIDKAIAQARELRAWSAPTDSLLPGNSVSGSVTDSNVTPDSPATQPTQSPGPPGR